MTSHQRAPSPGPTWAVLSQPPSSRRNSPSTPSSIGYSDHDFDLDMGDDEGERGAVPGPSSGKRPGLSTGLSQAPTRHWNAINGMVNNHGPAPASKRKAAQTTDEPSSGRSKPPKVPRLDPGGRSASGTPISDFPCTLSPAIQTAIARDRQREREREKEKEKAKEKTREQGRAGLSLSSSSTSQRAPPTTARKQTTQVKRVGMASLLKQVQRPTNNARNNESVAWTRIRPRGKAKRTSYAEEMASTRPLNTARQRGTSGDGNTIELTDSSDSARRPRPSQPSSILANNDDPIIITSSSEDDLAIRPTQWRVRGPNRRRGPPPEDIEVILIPDSDEDVSGRGVAPGRPTASASTSNQDAQTLYPSRAPSAVPLSAPNPATERAPSPAATRTTAPAPIPEAAPASTSTQLPEPPPLTPQDIQQPDPELPTLPSPSPSFGPPPDDFDDPFDHIDFDATGDNARSDDALGTWDGLDMGFSLASLPATIPSGPAGASVPEGCEDSGSEGLFDSYMNMGQLGGDADQGVVEGARLGEAGDGALEQAGENGAVNGPPGASVRVERDRGVLPPSRRKDNVNGDKTGGADVRMQSLEEGELDDDGPVPSTHIPGTQESGEIQSQTSSGGVSTLESGEIRSQESSRRGETQTENQPASSVAPPRVSPRPVAAMLAQMPTLASLSSPTSLSPSFGSPHSTASQPSVRTRTLAMPDISSYKGLRFKRSFPEARENSFFSRALYGAVRSGKAREGTGTSGSMSTTPAEVSSSDGKAHFQDRDADMQDNTTTSMPEVPMASSPGDALMMTTTNSQSISSTGQAQPLIVESSTTANDSVQLPSSSTQPIPSSSHGYATPPASQPLTRSSSRPFIAPPRISHPKSPMSLVDVFNELRRDRLQAEKEELARKRSGAGLATVPNSASQDPKETPSGPQPQPSTPAPASSQPRRMNGRTPSLNDIRALLARHNALSASQPVPSPPTHTSNDNDGEDSMPVEPAAVPAMALVSKSTGRPIMKNGGWNTPMPAATTMTMTIVPASGSGTPSNASAKRRVASFVPFEAFISPVRLQDIQNDQEKKKEKGTGAHDGKGKGKEVAHSTSPTTARPRASVSSGIFPLDFSSQRPRYKGRKSESDAFMAYIVRDSPKQTAGPSAHIAARRGKDTDTDTDTDANPRTGARVESLSTSPQRPRFPEGLGSLSLSSSSMASPEIPQVVPSPAPTALPVPDIGGGEDGDGEDCPVGDGNAMDVGVDARDGTVDSARVEDGETREMGREDETDALSQLASVHLSLTGADAETEATVGVEAGIESKARAESESVVEAEAEATGEVRQASRMDVEEGGEMDVIDESAESFGEGEGDGVETRVVAMAVDEPREEPEISGGDLEMMLDDALGLSGRTDAHMDTNAVTDRVEPLNSPTIPDLVLPEDDDVTSSVQLSSKDFDQGRPSGADSVTECDALPTSRDEGGLEVESEAAVSSKTVSNTSLVPSRTRSRSLRNSSEQQSPSGTTPPVDVLDLADQSKPVSEPTAGYRTVTWTSWVAEERERPPVYRLSKDLSHSLQDYMNAFPAWIRNSDIGRKAFEAHIREAATGEPDAPPIEILDNEIGDEVTPQWEFHYSNEMWFGEGVPPPDVKGLASCECVGRCDPKSNTCACARRQLEWVQSYIDGEIIPRTWPGSPFVYDHKGLLQRLECPIFECNRFCSCEEDCPNRVVQNGRKWPVHIAKTAHKGWGVFAGNKKIPKGSYIGIYAGELLTEQEGEARGKYYDLYGRTYLFSIDFHHLKLGMADPDDWENLYVVDAYHAGNFTRFLNHSCDPNCKIFACYIDDADVDKPLLAVFTTREVEPWEELCFSYYGDIDEKREEIEEERGAGNEMVREHAVYARCRCEAENCIGRLFS